ncbi:MAG TPA: radical SAM protein, partial [bacterium]|nr:radical SAM protein [bacterium]
LGDVLACADHVGFCGYGETLLMPDIIEFLDYINGKLPHTRKIFTTNGSPLTDGVIGKLSEGLNAVIISLHAADAGLHRRLTGLKNYEFILKAVRKMTDFKKRTGRDLHTNLVFLLTRMNVDNLPDFVRLGADLGVDRLTCNYITIFNEEQVEMSCFLEKEKTLDRMEEAEKLAAELGVTLVLPPKFGKQAGRSSVCQDPWNFCYIETQGSVLPCCSAGDHIGYLDKEEFSRIWNGYGYVRLRKGLSAKTPFFWCEDCCKYDPNNVNKFISHVTFRPETRKKLLAFYERHSAKKN